MAKEQKTAEMAGKQAEKPAGAAGKQPENAGSREAYQTKYSVAELADAAAPLFGAKPVIARAALKAAGKGEYTEEEAVRIVKAFMGKEV